MELHKVEGHASIQKDVNTGAVLNTDREALLAARRRREAILAERNKVKSLEEKIDILERALNELLERGKNNDRTS